MHEYRKSRLSSLVGESSELIEASRYICLLIVAVLPSSGCGFGNVLLLGQYAD
jgi:hypothetical protein